MKRLRRSTRIILLVASLGAVLGVLHLCLRPGINSPSWWLTEAVDQSFFTGFESQHQEYLLGQVARAQAESGNIADAIGTVKTIREPVPPFVTKIRKWLNDLLIRIKIRRAPPAQPVFNLSLDALLQSEARAHAAIAAAQVRAGDFAGAAATAQDIDTRTLAHAEAWLSIGAAQANDGDFAAARDTAGKMTDPASTHMAWGRIHIYKTILIAKAKAGDLSEARKMLKNLPERFPLYGLRMQERFQIDLVKLLAEKRNLTDTRSVVNDIEDPYARASAQCAIAEVLARSGRIDDAKAAAQQIERGAMQNRAQAEIAYGLAAAGSAPKAMGVAGAIADANARSFACLRVCEAQLDKGDMEGAKTAARQIADRTCRGDAYCAMLSAQLEAGDLAGARATVELVSDDDKTAALLSIAEAHAAAGDLSRAMDFIALARGAADAGSAAGRPKSYQAVAETQARIGDIVAAAVTIGSMTKGYRFSSGDDSAWSEPGLQSVTLARLRLKMLRATAKAYAAGTAPLDELRRHTKTLKTPLERAHAYLGAAEGLIQKQAADRRNQTD